MDYRYKKRTEKFMADMDELNEAIELARRFAPKKPIQPLELETTSYKPHKKGEYPLLLGINEILNYCT